ncbi:c-type cytochrome [Tropicimonas isoalkanivorans]|uniref:Cytochrome c n=1 Tax=Tropicimonas isoalkanivorans TaxID=441112 RepID=A0A1I1LBL6_9RHOB|nr:cytochrome c [Tropicimonas isoalkanivorans]SFC70419.1 Cytochrome c [Tropicimonas isoalkanivorans]
MRRAIGTAILSICFATASLAADEPYIAAGKRMAEANCANCHNIAPGGAFKLYPPSFQAIAIYMDPDVIRMKVMYPDHAVIMPQFHTFMFVENLDNIVGYIQSLDK